MRVFHCDGCQNLVFFENTRCVACSAQLGYLPEADDMVAVEPAGDDLWRPLTAPHARYRLCSNYSGANVCNWLVPAAAPGPYCTSCRLTRVIPDLSVPEHERRWYRIEQAKRRLVRQLQLFGLPLASRLDDPERGLAFELLADPIDQTAPRVMTGHAGGVITINIAEADDAERERRRLQMDEPYRTLLGHVRHEIGHYYFDRLVLGSSLIDDVRALFGDERADYGAALDRHYREGPPSDWQQSYVSAYASSHPHEDWTETWAHYFHMTETVETARAAGLSLRPRRADEPRLLPLGPGAPLAGNFTRVLQEWFPLTYVLNNLNRGIGMPDPYPFVLTPVVIDKLALVDRVVAAAPRIARAEGRAS